MSPPNDSLSLTATDNPATTTAYMLGQIQGELKSLNNTISSQTASIAAVKSDVEDLKKFRLKMYLVVGAISGAINAPTLIQLLK